MRALGVMAVIGWSAVASAQSGPNPYLNQAKVFYQGLEFEKCVQRLDQATRWKSSPQELVDIEVYGGLCRYNLGLAKDAEDHFLLALQLDRGAKLPPFTSPKIQEVFDRVKLQLPAAPAADAPKRAELAPAAPPAPVSGADAAIASDAGRGRSLGMPVAFGAAAVAAAGAGVFFGLQARSFEAQANAAHFESDAVWLGQSAQQRALFANVGYGVALAAATGAVVSFLVSGDGG